MNLFLKKSIAYASIAAILLALLFVEREPIAGAINFVKNYSAKNDAVLNEVKQEIFTPPLRSRFSGTASSLSPSNIISLTNQERIKIGLGSLEGNSLLDKAAMMKVQDIFNMQYFEHISPAGNGPGYLADAAGYSYVVIGENLALGTFKDDASLVKAWMDSPGHRENILNVRYQNIGVAVGQGIFKGERVYVAVQEFGKPASACPSASLAERLKIDNDRADADKLNSVILAYKQALDNMSRSTAEENSAYSAKVAEYNSAVLKYNDSTKNLRAEIDAYNIRVRDFNACVAK